MFTVITLAYIKEKTWFDLINLFILLLPIFFVKVVTCSLFHILYSFLTNCCLYCFLNDFHCLKDINYFKTIF